MVNDASRGEIILIALYSIRHLPGTNKFLTAGDDCFLRIWCVEKGSGPLVVEAHKNMRHHLSYIRACDLTPDGKILATGCCKMICLWAMDDPASFIYSFVIDLDLRTLRIDPITPYLIYALENRRLIRYDVNEQPGFSSIRHEAIKELTRENLSKKRPYGVYEHPKVRGICPLCWT